MRKITDERLLLKNLKNIRIAFVVLYVGVVFLLGYDAILNGWGSMIGKPLWFVWMLTNVVLAFLQINISVDHEKKVKHPGSYLKVLLPSLVVGILIGVLTAISPESNLTAGILIGFVIFLCTLIPFSYIYYLKKKRYASADSE